MGVEEGSEQIHDKPDGPANYRYGNIALDLIRARADFHFRKQITKYRSTHQRGPPESPRRSVADRIAAPMPLEMPSVGGAHRRRISPCGRSHRVWNDRERQWLSFARQNRNGMSTLLRHPRGQLPNSRQISLRPDSNPRFGVTGTG